MIHTFEIYCSIDGRRAREILRYFGVPCWKSKFKGDTGITGLAAVSLWQRKESGQWLFKIVVNPAKLLYGYDAFETIPADHETMEELSSKFAAALSKFANLEELPVLSEWLVLRIDYAVDVRTPYVDDYVKLAQKGDKPSNYKDKSRGRSGSCYWQCKSCTGNTYNKADQMKNNGKPPEMIERARDLLRVEVQCNSPKVSYLRSKNNIGSRELKHFFNGEIARDVLLSYCRRIYKLGDYHSFNAASAIMERLGASDRRKKALKVLLKVIAQARSINEARKQLAGSGMQLKNRIPPVHLSLTPEQYSRNCKLLADLDINPVTIPREWRIRQLPSITKLIRQALEAIPGERADQSA